MPGWQVKIARGSGISIGTITTVTKGANRIIRDNNLIKGLHPLLLSLFSLFKSIRWFLMLFLLLLYGITQSVFGEAIPVSSIETRDPSGYGDPNQTRTIWNIVWSCLSTIFLCTWVSLHPNISSTAEEPGMSRLDKLQKSLVDLLSYKLPLFLWALLVPEYILAWAIRQYITARDIQKRGGFFLFLNH